MTAVAPDPTASLVAFGRELRSLGLPVETTRILTFCRAAAVVGVAERGPLYWAARASLVSHPDHLPVFDRAFDAWFGGRAEPRARSQDAVGSPPPPDVVSLETDRATGWAPATETDETEGEAAIRIAASDVEVLRHRSFEDLSEEERRVTEALIRGVSVTVPKRRTRRLGPARTGRHFDLPRTLRRSLRTEGEPFHRTWRDRRPKPRPFVLVLDVSGSMGAYSRALLQFAFAARAASRRIEAFCFGTRLTRITPALSSRDPDRALEEASRAVADWEGGTRIGDSLKELMDRWASRTALRGAVVLLLSDGLERGDPAVLRTQMARLSRLAHRVVWVNPLKGSPRYEPLARGMAAALPHVDEFLPGHDLSSLQSLARVLAD